MATCATCRICEDYPAQGPLGMCSDCERIFFRLIGIPVQPVSAGDDCYDTDEEEA